MMTKNGGSGHQKWTTGWNTLVNSEQTTTREH
jgi:hypothetical protein